ncbi:MAG: ABC transporter permease [candidate division Zixibacteria bacterium]|nr:ABC transporter permease [candidate division Zixibacteria bacterium]
MGSIGTLALKDLRLLGRDKFGLFWVLAFPLLFAIFFGSIFSGGGSGSKIKLAVVDQDSTSQSRAYIEEMQESDALAVTFLTLEEAEKRVRQGKLTAYVVLEPGFGDSPFSFFSGEVPLRVGIDPSRRAAAAYLRGILTQLSFKQVEKLISDREASQRELDRVLAQIDTSSGLPARQRQLLKDFFGSLSNLVQEEDTSFSFKGNVAEGIKMEAVTRESDQTTPRSSFEIFFPSAIMWALLGCAATFGISIVKERTGGTYLRLRLAPISRAQILTGKGLACFISCVVVALLLMLIGRLIFGVRIDNFGLLLLAIVACGCCFVGIMMAISVLGKTEEAVGGAGWAILLIMAMLGGGMVPIMVMPSWLQKIGVVSPIKWGILSLEGAIWRGFALSEMLLPVGVLVGVGALFFTIGVLRFRCSEF